MFAIKFGIMPIEVVESVSDDEWDDFVGGNPRSNIFHTREYFECFRSASRYVTHSFFLREDGGVTACLIALQAKILGSALERLASRSVVFGGILCSSEVDQRYIGRHIGKLVRAYDDSLGGRALYSEVRNISDATPLILPFVENKHRFVPHLNYLVDLTRGEEEIWGGVSQAIRRGIRSTLKKGVGIVELSDESGIEPFYKLVSNTYAKVHIPCFEPEIFRNAWRTLSASGRLRIIFAEHEGRSIAARAALIYRGRVFDWFAGSSPEGDVLKANPLLAWDMIKWGCDHGLEVFDFGGAGDPNRPYSVRDFKSRFQGRLVNFGRFVKVYAPVRYALGYVAYNAIRRWLF